MSSDGGDVVESVGSSFFKWLQEDMLPVLYCIIMVTIFVVGIILHSIVLAGLSKNKLYRKVPFRLMLHVEILDLTAVALIILSAIVSSAAKGWLLGDYGCTVGGYLVTMAAMMTMYYAAWSTLERCLSILKTSTHKKLFGGKLWAILLLVQVFIVLAYCVLYIPEVGVAAFRYRSDGYQCDIMFEENRPLTHVHFLVFYMGPVGMFLVGNCFLVHHRRVHLQRKKGNGRTDPGAAQARPNSPAPQLSDNIKDKEQAGDSEEKKSVQRQETNANSKGPKKPANASNNKVRTSIKVRPHLIELFEANEEFHISLTMFITWALTFTLWLPYVIVGYMHAYETASNLVWDGWYPIVVMIAYISYAVKPVVFIGHNKILKAEVRKCFPKAVKKIEDTQDRVQGKFSKAESLLFKKPERLAIFKNNEVGTLIRTKLAVGRWKKKTLGKETDRIELKEADELANIATISPGKNAESTLPPAE